ncbi:GAF and ANTAR domain-containing protein [Actinoplanes regularis]|uniref:GAF and ANTAR domain-containing protein n=1 Tax=Actinoplanes regularis TaxID=52697 RepID=UPI0024A517AD|nr:GAF and ANTAR domain-containing protein [Actinoplanes regularis]GLW29360.1 GAF domain-containing protein [Actinoplanes regularis]
MDAWFHPVGAEAFEVMTSGGGADKHRAVVRGLIDRQPDHLDLLQRVCRAAVGALSACGAGISVMTADGTRGVSAASDPVSERIEELQFVLGEGPCLDAFASRRPVLTIDLSAAATYQWPVYAPAAQDGGVRAVFAFPLQVGAVRLGVIDIFRDRVGPLTDEELRTALGFAEVTVEALLDRQANGHFRDGDGAAVLAVGRRAELFQAQGMVMVQLGVSIGEALARIRAYAYAENLSLDDVARDVVNRRLRLDGDTE